ncbi:2OG-Fe(II) oxygenase [Allosphingosinicella deserti]|nr:2OG-Fe(II) oxygenase [Sphingomonas deserti]
MASPTIARVEALLNARRFDDAAKLLIKAASAGEAPALAELGHWRVAGNIVRRDLSAARTAFERAGAAGDRDSALLHAAFLASGVGGAADWPGALKIVRRLAPHDPRAAQQVRHLDAMPLDAQGIADAAPAPEVLSAAPRVEVYRSLLTAQECAYLVTAGSPSLQPSVVVDPQSGRLIPHPIRTSDNTQFGVYAEDMVVNAINRRIAAISGTAPEQGEPLQLLRYRAGGEYRAHMDALPGEPNQRVLTVIVYLNDGYEGGETTFVRRNVTFRGRPGDAILFANVTSDGRPDPEAQHAGLPVTKGIKLIATRWIRGARFTFPAPNSLLPY